MEVLNSWHRGGRIALSGAMEDVDGVWGGFEEDDAVASGIDGMAAWGLGDGFFGLAEGLVEGGNLFGQPLLAPGSQRLDDFFGSRREQVERPGSARRRASAGGARA